jgi:transcriptional regulator with XRE-family HTH domain
MPASTKTTDLRQAFGHVVRRLRIRASLSQEQLSFRADVHRTYVGDLERGLKSPTLEVIDRIAAALGTSTTVPYLTCRSSEG